MIMVWKRRGTRVSGCIAQYQSRPVGCQWREVNHTSTLVPNPFPCLNRSATPLYRFRHFGGHAIVNPSGSEEWLQRLASCHEKAPQAAGLEASRLCFWWRRGRVELFPQDAAVGTLSRLSGGGCTFKLAPQIIARFHEEWDEHSCSGDKQQRPDA